MNYFIHYIPSLPTNISKDNSKLSTSIKNFPKSIIRKIKLAFVEDPNPECKNCVYLFIYFFHLPCTAIYTSDTERMKELDFGGKRL